LTTIPGHLNDKLSIYIGMCYDFLCEMGALEHSQRHAAIVAERTRQILSQLKYDQRTCELGEIAGYLHDLGNLINRYEHGRAGAFLILPFLQEMQLTHEEVSMVLGAVGNHEENSGGYSVNPISAAVMIADKSDVARERVRKQDIAAFKPRDRVNFAVEKTWLQVDEEKKNITLNIIINQDISSVMEYFEIFLTKMMLCRRAAEHLNCTFELVINDSRVL